MKTKFINFLTLFTSMGTLICCALPALIVTLGFGSVMAGFLSKNPGFVYLSSYKEYVFAFSALTLTLGGYFQFRKNVHCPIGDLKEACKKTKTVSRRIYISSLVFFTIGFLFSYVFPYFMENI